MPHSRAAEIDRAISRIASIGLTWAERAAIVKLLFERKTHRQAAESEGITRGASKQRIKRARRRARGKGIEIPSPKRKNEMRTIAQVRLRRAA